ncbi:LacI family DNA-binding transcriptional regulator [Salinibacterium sp. SWN167]|uniref:LacI family DNA-binding transcriptional regulator n=1 Tax=Salinibacterium sp. SWN167 TaxID=2792054 RepID=UPI0018CD2595|nr:LacI family DNA-binding transcriptional regulator [Salinibacterium sp. SWN167]MBH0081883.1 LacI family DNA-binding transcriptional regulator [Salinibacterium sp. SWN167]
MSTVSVKDVAQHAGVSVGTVSNVMNHPAKVAPATVKKVQRAIEALGFVRNDAARQLRDGHSKTVGLVVLDVRNPFFTDVARGAETRAGKEGLSIILGNSDEDPSRELAYLDLFEQQRSHGVLISPIGEITPRLTALRDRGIPAVLVDRASPDRSFSSVTVDDVAGGRMAVEHLIAEGRTRIVFVGGPLSIHQVADRLEGARLAVREHDGVTLEVIDLDSLSVIAGRKAGASIAARTERPDAVFAANDLVAMGVLQALMLQGSDVRVPEDIALIGYDDIDFASAAVVPLSSIRQPAGMIGHTALEILLEEVEAPDMAARHVVFQPELVVRRSTSASAIDSM